MRTFLAAASVALVLLALSACGGQPYQVFAVQVAQAPAATASAAAPAVSVGAGTGPGRAAARELRARHPQWDVNAASAAELARLPGASPQTVAAIVGGRPYTSKRELLRRRLVSADEYARWKDYLVVHRGKREAARGGPPRARGTRPGPGR